MADRDYLDCKDDDYLSCVDDDYLSCKDDTVVLPVDVEPTPVPTPAPTPAPKPRKDDDLIYELFYAGVAFVNNLWGKLRRLFNKR